MSAQSRVKMAALIVLLVVLLGIPIGLYFWPRPSVQNMLPGTVAPTPAHPLTAQDGQTKRIYSTESQTVTFYWLYGRVLSVDSISPEGISLSFKLDGDPFATRLSLLLQPIRGTYTVREYDGSFKGAMTQKTLDASEVRAQVLEAGATLEFRLPFRRLQKTEEDTMAALEGPNRDDWKALPTQTLFAETVGIVRTK